MWWPANIHALPSTQELIRAKEVVHEIETKLATAVQADVALKKDLQGLKYFITPIRRLPFEIMSLIFEMCSRDGKTIARVAQVSQTWRSIALDNPQAWSKLTINSISSYLQLSVLLGHSAEHLLHLTCLTNSPSLVLSKYFHRIHCLSIDSFRPYMLSCVFQRTECLHIRSEVSLQSLVSSKFPVLRHLKCNSAITSSYSLFFLPDFPKLDSLSMSIAYDSGWIHTLRSCSTTLRYLKLNAAQLSTISLLGPLKLPNLVYLTIKTTFDRLFLEINMITPSLNTYEESVDKDTLTCNLHVDTLTVTLLRTDRITPQLEGFPGLQVLQMVSSPKFGSLSTILQKLLHNDQLCPKLERIEACYGSNSEDVHNLLLQVNQTRTCKITLTSGWKTHVPNIFRGTCEAEIHGIE